MDVIRTEGLCKSYRAKEVLHELNLHVPARKLIGFLGPNGAGKTTTIRLLLGLLKPTSGAAAIFGKDCWADGPEIRRQIGYLPGEIHFYGGLTGRKTLQFFSRARKTDCAAEITRLRDVLELDLDKKVRSYSSGMKQKLGLIQALMHRPRLLILDEPTSGLDPLIRQALYEELRAVEADGRTVLFSSHTLSEVEELCDEVAVLRDGVLVEHERVDVLRRRAVRRVTVFFGNPESEPTAYPEGLEITERKGERVQGTWSGAVGPLLKWLADQPAVRDVSIAPPDLEDLFLGYYKDLDGPIS